MNTNTILENVKVTSQNADALQEATLLEDLAEHARERCWPDRARRFATRALVIVERVWGPNHPAVAKVLLCRAGAREECADFARAEADYRRAIDILQSLPRDRANLEVQRLRIRAAIGLARVACTLGRYREAETMLKGALLTAEEHFGWKHGEAANVLNALATLNREVGDFEKAFRLHRRALAIAQTTLGQNHPNVGAILYDIALLEQRRGRMATAESFARESLAVREKSLGPDHPHVASSAVILAEALQAQHKFDDAASNYGRALTIFERWFGPDHRQVATTLAKLGELFRAFGRDPRYVRPTSIVVTTTSPVFPSGTGMAAGLVQPGALYHH